MELLGVPGPGFSRAVKTSRPERVEMEGGRPVSEIALLREVSVLQQVPHPGPVRR